ncbi:SidA/IucD/PvdA family monooxygenase [Dactylosporangium vinaceum]|uniref:L-lysine N6-monooxygenase MbtG n=1 Tax=Dactylosporangium vinaceum TaxID=53362 RepID=A0ABV5M3U7_9ACTN|nr:SidA/IucD/PvdA family monooxygenase [Dactylosporangium vinaceum]UAB93537.1 SidA/IucD/PvdA family monooxygenase [Dactylosporangium vinaceum]
MYSNDLPTYHVAGVGAGPANLSLAALFPAANLGRAALFDSQPGPAWHPALLSPGVRMQTSWMKDLVSLVDPQHPLTFMNYLVTTGRLFALLNAQFDTIPRMEYVRYLTWAARRIEGIHYGTPIERVTYTGDGFELHAGGRPVARAQHLSVGVGTRAVRPAWMAGLPESVLIADDLGWRIDGLRADLNAPIAVVGGGQTGLECVLKLINAGFTDVRWLGRRQWFQTIDDSPVANEFYRPAHQQFLQQLSRGTRRRLVVEQGPTGDALTPGALRVLYQANYDRMLDLDRFPAVLYPGRDVVAVETDGGELVMRCDTPGGREVHRARHIIVAVGREASPVPFDDDLAERVEYDDDGDMLIEPDYSLRWKGMNGHRIFVLNRARYSHGVPDANLTLLPVRAAGVINAMAGRAVYNVIDELCPVRWIA